VTECVGTGVGVWEKVWDNIAKTQPPTCELLSQIDGY